MGCIFLRLSFACTWSSSYVRRTEYSSYRAQGKAAMERAHCPTFWPVSRWPRLPRTKTRSPCGRPGAVWRSIRWWAGGQRGLPCRRVQTDRVGSKARPAISSRFGLEESALLEGRRSIAACGVLPVLVQSQLWAVLNMHPYLRQRVQQPTSRGSETRPASSSARVPGVVPGVVWSGTWRVTSSWAQTGLVGLVAR